MISARAALLGSLRSFFETELCGLYSWDQVKHEQAQRADPIEHGRRNPLGKFNELVEVEFGDFGMSVSSPEHAPPLGRIEVRNRKSGTVCSGVIDHATWVHVGRFIKGKHHG